MKTSKLLPALLAASAASALVASPADAARVKQVRVGDHSGFTRIVVELDGPASYTVDQKSVAGVAELRVGLDATTSQRVITSRSRLVESVSLRPGPDGAEARIQLRGGAVRVKEMVLKSPTRIVLDISPTPAQATAPGPVARASSPPVAEPTAPPRPIAQPTASSRAGAEPAAASPPKSAAAAAAQPTPTPKPDVAGRPAPPTRREIERALRSEVAHLDSGAAAPGAGPADAAAASEAAEGPAAAPGASDRTAAGPSPPSARAPSPEARGMARAPAPAVPLAAAPSLFDRLGAGDPAMGLSVALGGVALLLAAFLLLRRRSQRIAREAAAAPWPPPGAEERPEYLAAQADGEASEPEPTAANQAEAPLLGAPDASEGADEDDEDPVVELPVAPVDSEPEVVAKADEAPRVDELERRVERLEARLADSLDVRERLERQLAAHTEELRVQRAAIARTQRAVRAAVRGPEGSEAPAPQRVPSQVPPTPGPGDGEG